MRCWVFLVFGFFLRFPSLSLGKKKRQKTTKAPHPEHGTDDLSVGQDLLHEPPDGICFLRKKERGRENQLERKEKKRRLRKANQEKKL